MDDLGAKNDQNGQEEEAMTGDDMLDMMDNLSDDWQLFSISNI